MQRKLTVILSADVAAYSSQMQADEAGTLQRLKANRAEIFDPMVAAYKGRVFKLMGDGALVEFPSVVAAVECALAVQAATDEAANAAPEAQRLRYRIGINLGEVIVDGDDIYGEGVNAAARLQAVASVGGVALSKMVRDAIDGKIAVSVDDLGEHQVKDLERPVHAYAVRGEAAHAAPASAAPAAPGVSICVLPFLNMSGDTEQQYFADGITEDIITDLSKVSALFVVARNTAFQFKGRHVDVPQIARQLKVGYVLEGSVRKSGGRVRITAQLIDGRTGGHLWAERYDRDLSDIFELQDEISEAVVVALKLKLLPDEKKAIERRGTNDPEAYELFLMARDFQRKGSERLKPVIMRICRRAVEIDPSFAKAWALMSLAESEMCQRGVEGCTVEGARASAERAIAADPTLSEGHAALAEAMVRGLFVNEPVDEALATALRLDPECYEANTIMGATAIGRRDYEAAIKYLERAIEIDPQAYWPAGMVVQAYEARGDIAATEAANRRSLVQCEKILAVEPDHSGALGFFVTALAGLGYEERARDWTKRAVLFDPDNARLHYNLACAMAGMGDADATVDLIEPWIDTVSIGWLKWMQQDNSLDRIRNQPRFAALMARGARRIAQAEGGP